MASQFAQFRKCPYANASSPTSLVQAWDYSQNRIRRIREAFNSREIDDAVACIAVSGSLARMEAHSGSDVDLLVIVDDREVVHSNQTKQDLYRSLWEQMSDGISDRVLPPLADGIFSVCGSWKSLTDPAVRGQVNEDMLPYGQRMQLLMDAQPVFGDAAFDCLFTDLIGWSTESRIHELFDESGVFHWLWQEVQRYWRSLRARACWSHTDEPRASVRNNVKIRSSRVALIGTFLKAISESHEQSSVTESQRHLQALSRLTPLERLQHWLPPIEFEQMLKSYEVAWNYCATGGTADCFQAVKAAVHQIQDSIKLLAANGQTAWIL